MQEGRRSCDGILDVPVPDDGAHGDAFARKLLVNMHILRGRFGELDRNAFRLDLSHLRRPRLGEKAAGHDLVEFL